jgi:hypothetical protein
LLLSPPRRQVAVVAAVLLATVPVAFGVIRAISTGSDLRYIWLAGAAILGSMAAGLIGGAPPDPARVVLWRALAAVAAGAICAGVTAILMGAKAGPGIAIVATAFGLCTGVSAMFARLARQPQSP